MKQIIVAVEYFEDGEETASERGAVLFECPDALFDMWRAVLYKVQRAGTKEFYYLDAPGGIGNPHAQGMDIEAMNAEFCAMAAKVFGWEMPERVKVKEYWKLYAAGGVETAAESMRGIMI